MMNDTQESNSCPSPSTQLRVHLPTRQYQFNHLFDQRHTLETAHTSIGEKQKRLDAHMKEIEKVEAEIERVYRLYQDDKVAPEAFNRFFLPLAEREKQLEADLPPGSRPNSTRSKSTSFQAKKSWPKPPTFTVDGQN